MTTIKKRIFEIFITNDLLMETMWIFIFYVILEVYLLWHYATKIKKKPNKLNFSYSRYFWVLRDEIIQNEIIQNEIIQNEIKQNEIKQRTLELITYLYT